jgi:hypothetical protein
MNFTRWLLGLAIRNADEREMILGDLQEELPRRGDLWYAREAIGIAAHAVLRRSTIPGPAPARGDFFMTSWLKDIRYAWRGLRKRPLLTVTVGITLALGLGANAAIFNLIDRLVIHPLPFADPAHAVMLAETGPGIEFRKESVSPAISPRPRGGMPICSSATIRSASRERSCRRITSRPSASAPCSAAASSRTTKPSAAITSSSSATSCGSGDSTAIARSSAAASPSTACRIR